MPLLASVQQCVPSAANLHCWANRHVARLVDEPASPPVWVTNNHTPQIRPNRGLSFSSVAATAGGEQFDELVVEVAGIISREAGR